MEEGWSARPDKIFAELGSCEHLFLYVIGAAGTLDDGQNVPAAPRRIANLAPPLQ